MNNFLDKDFVMSILFAIGLLGLGIYTIATKLVSKYNYHRINKISFKDNESYYRDIIKKYSIAELSYIEGFEFDYYNDLVAILLKLERCGVLKVENDKIVILKRDNINLKASEQYIVDSVKNGTLINLNSNNLKKIIETECMNDGLIEMIPNTKKAFNLKKEILLTFKIIIPLVLTIIALLVAIYKLDFPKAETNHLLNLIYFLFLLLMILPALVVFTKAIIINGKNATEYKLLDNGKDIYIKLIGLKNYIKNFSKLSEKEKEYLNLWDDYLIYSVMFGLNKQIPEKYIKVLMEPDIYISANSNKGIYHKH